jgi:hypothetical protein
MVKGVRMVAKKNTVLILGLEDVIKSNGGSVEKAELLLTTLTNMEHDKNTRHFCLKILFLFGSDLNGLERLPKLTVAAAYYKFMTDKQLPTSISNWLNERNWSADKLPWPTPIILAMTNCRQPVDDHLQAMLSLSNLHKEVAGSLSEQIELNIEHLMGTLTNHYVGTQTKEVVRALRKIKGSLNTERAINHCQFLLECYT